MKIEQIPEETRRASKKIAKKHSLVDNPWHVVECPEMGIAVVTDGDRGQYKAGLKGWIIGGQERTVYLGERLEKTVIPEFFVMLESGCQFVAQYGRDIVFVK